MSALGSSWLLAGLGLGLGAGASFWGREGFTGLGVRGVLAVRLGQRVIYRLMTGREQGGPS